MNIKHFLYQLCTAWLFRMRSSLFVSLNLVQGLGFVLRLGVRGGIEMGPDLRQGDGDGEVKIGVNWHGP